MPTSIPSMETSFDLEDPFSSPSHSALFSAEEHHATSLPSLLHNLPLRRATASLLLRHQPPLAYLAVNYLDRFLSARHLPPSKPWLAPLLAAACLSLASKMYRLEPLQTAEDGLAFDRTSLQRMEITILAALEWRMRSITPFSFLGFFLGFLQEEEGEDPAVFSIVKSRTSCMLFAAQNDLRLAGFRPSVIAASGLLVAARDLFPARFPSFWDRVSSCAYLLDDTAMLRECCDALAELAGNDLVVERGCGRSFSSSRDTPVSVLRGNRHFPSSESEITSPTCKKARID